MSPIKKQRQRELPARWLRPFLGGLTFLAGLTLAINLFAAVPGSAQSGDGGFATQSYDDDFSYLCGKQTYKCVEDGHGGYISFGGRIREQVLEGRPDDFGLLGSRRINATLLHRLLVHADWHIRPGLRLFLELGNHLEAWRPGGPRPTDKDLLDFQQAFIDYRFMDNDSGRWTWRFGRQQITLGSYRLVAPRDNANILITFDGNVVQWQRDAWTVRALELRPVLNKPGYFEDGNDPTQRLWGVYATRSAIGPYSSVDLYWLGFDNADGKIYKLQGDDHRESYGTRFFGATPRWDYDIEPIIQRGDFADHPIKAWAFFSTSGYTLRDLPFTPRLGLRSDYASGSHHPGDGTTTTFHPLIGPAPLLTDANLNTAANLIDVDPSVDFHLTDKLTVGAHYVELWRASREDAFYGRGLIPIIPGNVSRARHIGSYHRLTTGYEFNDYVSLDLDLTHFEQGAFSRAGHALAGNYVTITAYIQF